MKTRIFIAAATALMGTFAHAQNFSMNADLWDVSEAQSASFETVSGRESLCFEGGAALYKGGQLKNGTLIVDIENKQHPHFGFLVFRATDAKNSEDVYLRMHKSKQLDAVQYNPHINDEPTWQLFGGAQVAADFGDEDWVTLQVAFSDNKARATVTSSAGSATLDIDDLALKQDGAGYGLRALFPTCFSNFRITTDAPDLSDIQTPRYALDAGMITSWKLSPQTKFEGFPDELWLSDDWPTIEAEPNGQLIISRHVQKKSAGGFGQNEMDIVFVGAEISSKQSQRVKLNFDVSDIGRVYLNGVPLVELNNSIRAKGNGLFRGDFSTETQSVFLELLEGKNQLVFAVAERTNGWGVAAKLDNLEGLMLETSSH